MNPISKSHKRFSERLNNPRVLEYPEEFLGPNYKEVLNFWLILDDLPEEQLEIIEGRYEDFYNKHNYEWYKLAIEIEKACNETIGYKFTVEVTFVAAFYYDTSITFHATLELIGMHKILENHQQPLTFLPMFLEVL